MESEDYMLDIMLSPGNTFACVNSSTVSRTRNMNVTLLNEYKFLINSE